MRHVPYAVPGVCVCFCVYARVWVGVQACVCRVCVVCVSVWRTLLPLVRRRHVPVLSCWFRRQVHPAGWRLATRFPGKTDSVQCEQVEQDDSHRELWAWGGDLFGDFRKVDTLNQIEEDGRGMRGSGMPVRVSLFYVYVGSFDKCAYIRSRGARLCWARPSRDLPAFAARDQLEKHCLWLKRESRAAGPRVAASVGARADSVDRSAQVTGDLRLLPPPARRASDLLRPL